MFCNTGRTRNQHGKLLCPCKQEDHADGGPEISRLDPFLQQQWDHAANAHLGSTQIKPYSKLKVWWRCDQCPDGHPHRWEACVGNRTSSTGCPQCSGHKVCKHNSLATKAPLVAAQWDFEANDGTPDSVVAQSRRRVGWLCGVCGHKWSQTPNQRVCKGKAGCPRCAEHTRNLKGIKHPTFAECQDPRGETLLAEWDHERNAAQGNFPQNTRMQSHKQIFWLCTNCPAGQQHSWSAAPGSRYGRNKTGCPCCAGHTACKCNSLQALYPDIASQWHYAKNQGHSSDHTAASTYLAWWISPKRGSWQQTILSRTQGLRSKPAMLKRIQQRQKTVTQF